MNDHVKDQLCARIEELEKEKLELNEQLDALQEEHGALAAHLERMRDVWQRLHLKSPSPVEVLQAYSYVMRETPATSLARLKAQWQAEVLESCENIAETSFIPCLGREEQVVLMDGILKVAAELRRQAEGGV